MDILTHNHSSVVLNIATAGAITSWNDPLLIAANFPNGQYLPNKPIIVIGRTGSTDANAIFLRYLALRSTTFMSQYTAATKGNISLSSTYYRSFSFPALRASGRFIPASQNLFVDNQVLALDGTFGYYLQTTTPNSKVAWFCNDAQCFKPINPSDGGLSLGRHKHKLYNLSASPSQKHNTLSLTNKAFMISVTLLYPPHDISPL